MTSNQIPLPGFVQIVSGWWGHQPGLLAVGGVPTAHINAI